MKKRHCFALDLFDDPVLIEAYKKYHEPENVWPEILESIRAAGVSNLEIYLTGNRLFMILEADDSFNLTGKTVADAGNPNVQEWEELMWKFQKALPWAKPGEKWVEMERIFQL